MTIPASTTPASTSPAAATEPSAGTDGPITVWRQLILARVHAGARFAGLFGTTEPDGCRVTALLSTPDGFDPLTVTVHPDGSGALRYPSLSPQVPAAFWYERALHDLSGVVPVGHPRLDPLLLDIPDGAQAPLPGGPVPPVRLHPQEQAGPADVTGRGVFTIPFGPVRSGIVESIEFLIETPGEDIPYLHIRPHYKHRGMAKAFEGRTVPDGVLVAERVEGIASVAHALAFSHAVEAITDAGVPARAGLWRVVHAELERIVNHLDVAVRLTDAAGLGAATARFGWHKETAMRLVSRMCGNRFGRGVVIPGGVAAEPGLPEAQLGEEVTALHGRIAADASALMNTASFLDRVRGTGRLEADRARVHGALGPVGRGSGYDDDDRRHRARDAYPDLPLPVFDPAAARGDAMARLRVRWTEIDTSAGLITAALQHLAGQPGPLRAELAPGSGSAVGWAEGPQGEELYSLELQDGRIRRCFARSASLHNLVLLHDVFHGDVLTDFPFIEASFGLCYAGVAM